jgi:hypothetical protein
MTQELIANMLGVRRQGVVEAAGNLQKAGLIDYRRGHIRVLDRPGLEARVCECYAVVRREYERLLPASHSAAEDAAIARSVARHSASPGKRLINQNRRTADKGSPGV